MEYFETRFSWVEDDTPELVGDPVEEDDEELEYGDVDVAA